MCLSRQTHSARPPKLASFRVDRKVRQPSHPQNVLQVHHKLPTMPSFVQTALLGAAAVAIAPAVTGRSLSKSDFMSRYDGVDTSGSPGDNYMFSGGHNGGGNDNSPGALSLSARICTSHLRAWRQLLPLAWRYTAGLSSRRAYFWPRLPVELAVVNSCCAACAPQ